jgi:CBS domain-containing protein
MAIAGPLTSLVLAAMLWGVSFSMGVRGSPFAILTGNYSLMNSLGAALIYYLSSLNLILALFNLIPAFPLDGGRVLRSLIWEANKDLTKSTNIAATVGRYFGWAMITYGVFTLVEGDILGGLWIAFIGWFLASAAGASRRQVRLRSGITGVLVKEVMNKNPVTINPATTIETAVRTVFLGCHCDAALVSTDHQTMGMVTLDDVKKIPQEQWPHTSVEQIMTREPLYSVSPEDDLNTAMRLLAQYNLKQILVLKSGELVGVVNHADIMRHLEITQELSVKNRKQMD